MNRSPYDKDSLIIDRKQASRIVSALLLCAFFIFISGYFLGKKKAIEELTSSLEQEAFSDQLALNESNMHSFFNDRMQSERNEVVTETKEVLTQVDSPKNLNNSQELYVAQLCGFGTKKAAQQMIDRLKKVGITTNLVTRVSKPVDNSVSKRKIIQWYQVISEQYADQCKLQTLVDAVKRLEKIHDVQIVKVKDGKARKNT